MKTLIASGVILTGCGTVTDAGLNPIVPGKEIVIISPQPKTLEVGQKGAYVVDPKRSSDLVKSGVLTVEVTAVDDKEATVYGSASVQTMIGVQKFELTNHIENELLTPEFMAELRAKKTHAAKEFNIQWLELTPDGCDIIELTAIKGMDDAVLRPTICLANRTIPSVKITVKTNGMTVPVTFVAVE